jgi:predicted nucleotidyltransferase component of viral defense system
MISNESFSPVRISEFRKNPDFNKTDPAIIEKMIRALSLLEKLAANGLEFVFKGGTSLILLLDRPNRFSIDIDITTSVSREKLEGILNSVIKNSEFTSFNLDEKRSYKGDFPKAHYKFYWSERGNDYILLDVQYGMQCYPELLTKQIKSDWLITEEPYFSINLPTKESILGDKLTAFAPNTTGVLYGKNKETEIIKQLFDVSILIDEITDIKKVHQSFTNSVKNEVLYRNPEISHTDVLNDIIKTALILSRREKNIDEPDKSNFMELSAGLRSFNNFLIRGSFRIEHAIEASAKAAWLAVRMKQENYNPVLLFKTDIELLDWTNTNTDYTHIAKLKRSNQAAYHYWWNCLSEM